MVIVSLPLLIDLTKNYDCPNRFERFLFAPTHPGIVAFFRLALALMLIWTFRPTHTHVSKILRQQSWLLELYDHVFLTTPYYLLIVALLVLFGMGWRPRLIGLPLVVILLPLDFLSGSQPGRQIMIVCLLAFSLLRSDAALTWKSMNWKSLNWQDLLSWRDRSQTGRSINFIYPQSAGPMWPIRLIQLQLSVLYGVNAVAKTTPHYLSGEAFIGMTQAMPNFRIDLSSGYLHLGSATIPAWFLAVASVTVEYALAVGFWIPRWRIATAILGVLFHSILKFVVQIHMLDWVSMFLYLAFLLPFDGRTSKRRT